MIIPTTFRDFADFLVREIDIELAKRSAIEQACQMVEGAAKDAIGTYVFGWPHLDPETIARKAHGDTPLLETGELRDSISHYTTTEGGEHVGYVGSPMKIAAYHEMGTKHIPPRSFIGAAARSREHEIVKMMNEAVGAAMMGRTAFAREWRHALHALKEAWHEAKKLGEDTVKEE